MCRSMVAFVRLLLCGVFESPRSVICHLQTDISSFLRCDVNCMEVLIIDCCLKMMMSYKWFKVNPSSTTLQNLKHTTKNKNKKHAPRFHTLKNTADEGQAKTRYIHHDQLVVVFCKERRSSYSSMARKREEGRGGGRGWYIPAKGRRPVHLQ
jgi:hypothetical protein